MTVRRPSTIGLATQSAPPSGSQIFRHSLVSSTTCTGRPRA